MKPTVLSQHIKFFQKHKFIEFEEVFSPEKLTTLAEGMKTHLESKSKRLFSDLSFLETYKNGRDFWRSSNAVFSLIKERAILEILYLLCNKNTFRLAFDQILKISSEDTLPSSFSNLCLEEVSSFSPLTAGVLICVKKEKENLENQDLIFPQKEGNILIFDPSFLMPLPSLMKVKNSLYYFIGYSSISSRYVENKLDPLTNDCKQYGYGFGDVLLDKYHPVMQIK